jgi:hypothetical protein
MHANKTGHKYTQEKQQYNRISKVKKVVHYASESTRVCGDPRATYINIKSFVECEFKLSRV